MFSKMKPKPVLISFLAAFAAFFVGVAIYCLWTKQTSHFRYFPNEPKIAFQQTESNQKAPCLNVYYGMGDGDGVKDDYCSDLQQQLSRAASEGDVEKVKTLLRDGANAAGHTSISALQFAAREGNTEIARILLDNGADVNHWALSGTPLHCAVWSDNPETVELLLSRGANVHTVGDGFNALGIALEKNNRKIIAMLKKAGASEPIPDKSYLFKR